MTNGYFFKKEQPQWSGFLQANLSGNHPGKENFSFLTITNLNPLDIFYTSIYLESSQIPTPYVTFDQPLYIGLLRRRK